jgi:glycosyltransferase involved in cell wall biosynthesis
VRRLLFVAYDFPPVGGAGVQRSAKFARYLPEWGWQPVMITGPGLAADRWTPTDEGLAEEIGPDAIVHRARGPVPPRSSGWRLRAERWLGVPPPFAGWWLREGVAAAREAERGAEVVLATIKPYESAAVGRAIARSLGLPLVLDLRDPWALDEMMLYPTALHHRRDLARMRRALGAADAIVMNTAESAGLVRRRFPELMRVPVAAIPNGYDASDFAGPAPAPDPSRPFRIAHSGYLHTELGLRQRRGGALRRISAGPVRGVDILTRSHVHLLGALERLHAADPSTRGRVEVVLAGVLSPTDLDLCRRSRARISTPGYLSHRDSVALLRSADMLFLPMHDLPPGVRATIVPGKTYESLAAGPPVLAAVPAGDARDLLVASGRATVCEPSDEAAMARAIGDALARPRRGPVEEPPPEAVTRFERRALTGELAALLQEVAPRRHAVAPGARR